MDSLLKMLMSIFNSKMVRLRERILEAVKKEEQNFQFQNGAIESKKCNRPDCVHSLFQFQNGAIESILHRQASKRLFVFSIPKWCD